MNFKGAAKKLDDIDIPRIGHRIGVGEDEIHAVMDVEAAGSGFDKQGRPRALFEPHVFYRELGTGAKRTKAVKDGLAYPKWGSERYPTDSYPRIVAAMAIDQVAALRSTSWGLGQIMGFNAKLAGYRTAFEMVAAFQEDEEQHLNAMISFIISAGLDDEIRAHNWVGFAFGYNGQGYRKNQYDTKLASRFAFWQRIRDTPWVPEVDGPEPIKTGTAKLVFRRGDRGVAVDIFQRQLTRAGFYDGNIDGDFGAQTEAAVRRFQSSRKLLVDGVIGQKTADALGKV